jgi:hypothetical protein
MVTCMAQKILWLMLLTLAGPLFAAERKFDFSEMPTNQPPPDFISTAGGDGKPGTWKVIMDEMPLALAPLTTNAPATAPKAVVAQLAWNAAAEHYPMLLLGNEVYGDFTVTTKFKIVDGLAEQMAGLAFRIQDEKNYYYVRADLIGGTFYFCKVEKGLYSCNGNNMKIEKGVWHELSIECSGARIHIMLDGKEGLPMATDTTYSAGKIAYLTKSDTICFFTDTSIKYTQREPFAQLMVRDAMKEYTHLLGLKVMAAPPKSGDVHLIASNDEKEIGGPGEKIDADVINRGVNYFRKEKEVVYVTMPLRDRNGDVVASVRFVMKGFAGETEQAALVRATPILKKMQQRAAAADSLF